MSTAILRVLFMGTPDFAVPCLQTIADLGHDVVGVVSQPDRPKGRGRKLVQTPVAQRASELGLPLFQWPRLNNESFAILRDLAPDVAVVVAYGKILPQRYLDLPTHGCINVHASVLPKLRGAAPIQWSVIRGYERAGVSIMRLDAGMDTGDVALSDSFPIEANETSGELHDRLSIFGASLLEEALNSLAAGRLVFTEQNHDEATHAPRLAKSDGLVSWDRPAQEVHNHIRGMSPWPGAYVHTPKGPLKLHRSVMVDGSGIPGSIIAIHDVGPVIACADGAVCITRIQRPGKTAVKGIEYARSAQLTIGQPLVPTPS